MTSLYGSQINQELLSAFIDGEVNIQEQQLVEQAMAADPEIFWQVESLRHTVALLRELPAIPLPQSFVLPEARVADVVGARRAAARQAASRSTSSGGGLWQNLIDFLGGGNLLLRNAAAVAAVAFFVLVAGDLLPGSPTMQAIPAAAPAAELAQADLQATPPSLAFAAEETSAQAASVEEASPAEIEAGEGISAASASIEEPAARSARNATPLPATPEAEELIPESSPFGLGAEAQPGAGGAEGGAGGLGGGMGGGGGGAEVAPAPALMAAPDALPRSAAPAAEMQRIGPLSAAQESAPLPGSEIGLEIGPEIGQDGVAITATDTSSPTTQAMALGKTAEVTSQAPMAAAAEPMVTGSAVAELAAAEPSTQAAVEPEAAPNTDPEEMSQRSQPPAPSSAPFSPLRLAQIGLALVALLLSGLWVQSQ